MNGHKETAKGKPSRKRKQLLIFLLGICLVAAGMGWGISLYRQANPDFSKIPGTSVVSQQSSGPEPVRVKIPSLSIDAPVVRLGLNPDGTLQVPAGDFEVGWYAAGIRPGDAGPAIMVGHLDSTKGAAIFWHLKDLKPGDAVQVLRAEGSTVNFVVQKSENYSQDNFPSAAVYGPVSDSELRLITCSGRYNRQAGRYSQNLVVYARKS